MNIREVNESDFKEITKIYNYYIKKTVITFEEEIIDEKEMKSRFFKVKQSNLPYLIIEEDNKILGFAYAHLWHERSAFRFSVEPSIYLDINHINKGYGKLLFEHLLNKLKLLDLKNILSLITIPNDGSIKLHEQFGFKKVGELPNIGYKFEKYLSVGLWQLEL